MDEETTRTVKAHGIRVRQRQHSALVSELYVWFDRLCRCFLDIAERPSDIPTIEPETPIMPEPISIIHLILIARRELLLFQRPSGTWHTLSGTRRSGDLSCVFTASRELREETHLRIRPDKITPTGYGFSGISPQGKHFQCETLFTEIVNFNPSMLHLKRDELIGWQLVTLENAFSLLGQAGYPEATGELLFLKEQRLSR